MVTLWVVRASDPIITVTLVGFEDVTVPAGTFVQCAFIKKHSRYSNGTEYVSNVWLAKNVGMVKWVRDSSRIEELVEYSRSKKP